MLIAETFVPTGTTAFETFTFEQKTAFSILNILFCLV